MSSASDQHLARQEPFHPAAATRAAGAELLRQLSCHKLENFYQSDETLHHFGAAKRRAAAPIVKRFSDNHYDRHHRPTAPVSRTTANAGSGEWPNCYIANGRVIKSFSGGDDTTCIKRDKIVNPSSNVLLLDKKVGMTKATTAATPDWPFINDKSATTGRVGYYHSAGVNVQWTDGHASFAKGGSLVVSNFTISGKDTD